ncbi:MAG TPA: hypothetical protein PKC67_12695 [Kiritimatiellia bacterium]|nr:hypothetical protein [Kiritimatiellia bacterium]HMP35195.1 hypothetical protein [Kiritimatiellia bacterium]
MTEVFNYDRVGWPSSRTVGILLLTVASLLAVACSKKEDPPYRREMDGLMHENSNLKKELLRTENLRGEQANRADALQRQVDDLKSQLAAKELELAEQARRQAVLELEKELLQSQVDTFDQQRQAAEAAHLQNEQKRQQQIAAIATANQKPATQPPFRVFDVVYVGEKEVRGSRANYGRLSVRNYTGEALTVSIDHVGLPQSVTIPANSASNSIWARAEKGKRVVVRANNHTEEFVWE